MSWIIAAIEPSGNSRTNSRHLASLASSSNLAGGAVTDV